METKKAQRKCWTLHDTASGIKVLSTTDHWYGKAAIAGFQYRKRYKGTVDNQVGSIHMYRGQLQYRKRYKGTVDLVWQMVLRRR